jgi:hypothetical protein
LTTGSELQDLKLELTFEANPDKIKMIQERIREIEEFDMREAYLQFVSQRGSHYE